MRNTAAVAAAMTFPLDRVLAASRSRTSPIPIPPPISTAERLRRLARRRS